MHNLAYINSGWHKLWLSAAIALSLLLFTYLDFECEFLDSNIKSVYLFTQLQETRCRIVGFVLSPATENNTKCKWHTFLFCFFFLIYIEETFPVGKYSSLLPNGCICAMTERSCAKHLLEHVRMKYVYMRIMLLEQRVNASILCFRHELTAPRLSWQTVSWRTDIPEPGCCWWPLETPAFTPIQMRCYIECPLNVYDIRAKLLSN